MREMTLKQIEKELGYEVKIVSEPEQVNEVLLGGKGMTVQEAIRRLREHNAHHSKEERFAVYITEALNMAIEALEKQLKLQV